MPQRFPPDSSFPSGPAAGDGPFLPEAAAIVPARGMSGGAVSVDAEGEIEELTPDEALKRIASEPVMLVHAGFTARRIARGRNFREPGPQGFGPVGPFALVPSARTR